MRLLHFAQLLLEVLLYIRLLFQLFRALLLEDVRDLRKQRLRALLELARHASHAIRVVGRVVAVERVAVLPHEPQVRGERNEVLILTAFELLADGAQVHRVRNDLVVLRNLGHIYWLVEWPGNLAAHQVLENLFGLFELCLHGAVAAGTQTRGRDRRAFAVRLTASIWQAHARTASAVRARALLASRVRAGRHGCAGRAAWHAAGHGHGEPAWFVRTARARRAAAGVGRSGSVHVLTEVYTAAFLKMNLLRSRAGVRTATATCACADPHGRAGAVGCGSRSSRLRSRKAAGDAHGESAALITLGVTACFSGWPATRPTGIIMKPRPGRRVSTSLISACAESATQAERPESLSCAHALLFARVQSIGSTAAQGAAVRHLPPHLRLAMHHLHP